MKKVIFQKIPNSKGNQKRKDIYKIAKSQIQIKIKISSVRHVISEFIFSRTLKLEHLKVRGVEIQYNVWSYTRDKEQYTARTSKV